MISENSQEHQSIDGRERRSYVKVSDQERQQVINLIEKNMSFKQVSELMSIKHENVRRIYRIYLRENRVIKNTQGKPCMTKRLEMKESEELLCKIQRCKKGKVHHNSNPTLR